MVLFRPTAFLLTLLISAVSSAQTWIGDLRALGGDGLGNEELADSFLQIASLGLSEPRLDNLELTARLGWEQADEETELLLASERVAIRSAGSAAYAQGFRFPPENDDADYAEGLELAEPLAWLLGAEARRLHANGRQQGAAIMALSTLRIGDELRTAKNQPFPVTVAGVSMMESAAYQLQDLLADRSLDLAAVRQIGSALRSLDFRRETLAQPFIDGLPASAQELTQRARSITENEQIRQTLEETEPGRLAIYQAFAQVAQGPEANKVVREVSAEIQELFLLPNYARPRLNQQWFLERIPDAVLAEVYATQIPSRRQLVRMEALQARLAVLEMIAAYRSGLKDYALAIIDPFSGEPLRAGADSIYSIGPDQIDQGGLIEYSHLRGVFSPGDIVFRLSP